MSPFLKLSEVGFDKGTCDLIVVVSINATLSNLFLRSSFLLESLPRVLRFIQAPPNARMEYRCSPLRRKPFHDVSVFLGKPFRNIRYPSCLFCQHIFCRSTILCASRFRHKIPAASFFPWSYQLCDQLLRTPDRNLVAHTGPRLWRWGTWLSTATCATGCGIAGSLAGIASSNLPTLVLNNCVHRTAYCVCPEPG